MPQKECKTCRSTGEIVRGHDGRKIRCTTCLGEINHRRDIPRKSQSNEQTRIELTEYGIKLEHPPACTCVDCNETRRKRSNTEWQRAETPPFAPLIKPRGYKKQNRWKYKVKAIIRQNKTLLIWTGLIALTFIVAIATSEIL